MILGDFKKIVTDHLEKYPKMQIQDLIKLVYQNEFGGGHFVTDEEGSLQRLLTELEEYNGKAKEENGAELFTKIGNGLCRIDIVKANSMGLEPSTINRFFVNTANSVRGSLKSVEIKLDVLRDACSKGLLPFIEEDLDSYLNDYKAKGYRPVSHSETYRHHYQPAYRIVREDVAKYHQVFVAIDALLKKKSDPVTIAIDGNSGAGKSSFAKLLGDVYDCNIFHMDDFFLTPDLRTEERLNEAGGNVDYQRFHDEVIKGLQTGKEFSYRRFDCSTEEFVSTGPVVPKGLNIIEGSYSMHPHLMDHYDFKVFLQLNETDQRSRILARNGLEMYQRFIQEWIPLEEKYFKELNIKEKCDLIIAT